MSSSSSGSSSSSVVKKKKTRERSKSARRHRSSKAKTRRTSHSSRSSSSRRQRWRSGSSSLPQRKRKASSSSSSSTPVAKKSSKDKKKEKEKEKKTSKKMTSKKKNKKRKCDSSATSEESKRSKSSKKKSSAKKRSSKTSKRSARSRSKESKKKDDTGKDSKREKNGGRLPFEAGPRAKAAEKAMALEKSNGEKKKVVALGDLGALQKSLEEERRRLKLFVIKAKQEWEERRARRSANGVTDEDDYYRASIGEVFGPSKQFTVEERIGKGVFSSVFKCKNEADRKVYAVKFIRSNALMRKVSEKEVEMYRQLASKAPKEDPEGARHLISLVGPETFEHQGHLCLVFRLLKCDLRFALQKYGSGYGLPLPTIQQYSQQLLLALRALRRLKLIHGDLKPDNVLMSMDKSFVQLIDFGSATLVNERINSSYVQPRYYRAPEVMLGMEYDTQVDVWSLGTTLFELATGGVLFPGGSNNGMLKHMLDICGLFPTGMWSKSAYTAKHFKANGDFIWRCPKDTDGQEKVLPAKSFEKPPRPILGQLQAARDAQRVNEGSDKAALANAPENMDSDLHKAILQRLADLLTLCTKPDPAKRVTPEKALAHAFFKQLES